VGTMDSAQERIYLELRSSISTGNTPVGSPIPPRKPIHRDDDDDFFK
jgi:hypothetical protein